MKIENTEKMRNQYLSKVKNEFTSKKAAAHQSRSQFENYRNHLACLPKKSLLKVQEHLNIRLAMEADEGLSLY